MSHVLVISGQGFNGSHVCDSLVSHGHKIRVITRNPSRAGYNIPSAEYLYFDYGNTNKLADALEGIDCVIHLASSVVPSSPNLGSVSDIESNLVSTAALLDLIRKISLKKVIYLLSVVRFMGIHNTSPLQNHSHLTRFAHMVLPNSRYKILIDLVVPIPI